MSRGSLMDQMNDKNGESDFSDESAMSERVERNESFATRKLTPEQRYERKMS